MQIFVFQSFVFRRRCLYLFKLLFVSIFLITFMIVYSIPCKASPKQDTFVKVGYGNQRMTISLRELNHLAKEFDFTYERFSEWNQTLCSRSASNRGRHQKIIAISIYGTASNFSNNPMYNWDHSIIRFLEPLAKEIQTLLPSWTLRIYVDFTGSTSSQQELIYNISNADVCDMRDIPLFGSSLLSYLPGRFWRFLPVFDPYVDYLISQDLDSPMTTRQSETIDMWLNDAEKSKFFYIARDHKEHQASILAGLWGAAPERARQRLFNIFRFMLLPSVGRRYIEGGDQQFLDDFVWRPVKPHSLMFDSYYCERYGGRPFPSRRPTGLCFLGCIRPCCANGTSDDSSKYLTPCPLVCRPKDHQDWTYC